MGLAARLGGKIEKEQDFELNLASIIDCFTVLITYLLVAASFISLGVFDVGVATPIVGTASNESAGAEVDIAVELDREHNFRIKVTGKENRTFLIPARDGEWDLLTLGSQLDSLKNQWPDVRNAILAADDSIEYREIVKAVETARKSFPGLALGEKEGR